MKIIIVIILILLIYGLQKYILKYCIDFFNNNIDINIGNYMSVYFYNILKAVLSQSDFNYTVTNNIPFNKLSSHISYNHELKQYYDQLINNGITLAYIENINIPEGLWSVNDKRIEILWNTIKPLVVKIYDNVFKDIKINIPVIHFRCADVPFVRHSMYHFQYYKYYTDILNTYNYDTVGILYNNTHISTPNYQKSCNIYAESLKKYLEKNNYKVIFISGSNVDDFVTMYYAPVVISPSSSFSFMSGFFGKGIFHSAGHYYEGGVKCIGCGTWLKQGYDLEHTDVSDYLDTASVIKKLNHDPVSTVYDHFNANDNITVVSGYWNVKNKYKENSYDNWFNNTLKINQYYVFFCEESNIEYIKKFRNNLDTKFIVYNLDNFYSKQYASNKWIISTHVPSKELGMIWHEKIHLIKLAKDSDIVKTDFYIWIDAGIASYRNTMPPRKRLNLKDTTSLPKNKLCYSSVNESYHSFAASCLIIHVDFIDEFHEIYYKYLKNCNSMYCGSDQYIFTQIMHDRPELFYRIADGYGGNLLVLYDKYI